jgi:pimeloyl-ACP methyl ester carboxylesterase
MNMKPIISLIILIMAAVLLFAFKPKPKMTIPAGARLGDLTLVSYTYKTKTAAYQAERGVLIVPENHLNPSSRLIALPIKRIRAASSSPRPPIFHLTGGPGASNMSFTPPDELLANYDVVMVGYRGVDGSSRLECPEFSRATLGYGRDVLSDESLTVMAEAIRSCQLRIETEGIDLTGYTIQQVVEDLEAARTALGYEKVNLLSESYGTRLAQVYAYLYPQRLNRSVMIGVNPPGRFVWEPEMVDAQIRYYSHLWAQDEQARSRTPDLAETMRRVSHTMPHHWLFFPIDPGKVNALAFVLLFNRNTSATVFDAFVAAQNGDASGLALMSLAYDLFIPKSFVWGDFFAKSGNADLDTSRDYVAELRAPGSIIGSPISLMIWGSLSQSWDEDLVQADYLEAQPGDVETLLVSGSVDFSTPAEYATTELLPTLRNGRQVILSEMGHVRDVWNVQPEATLHLLTSFYDTGKADASQFRNNPVDFQVSLGFPILAKILLVSGVLPVIGLVMVARKILHR